MGHKGHGGTAQTLPISINEVLCNSPWLLKNNNKKIKTKTELGEREVCVPPQICSPEPGRTVTLKWAEQVKKWDATEIKLGKIPLLALLPLCLVWLRVWPLLFVAQNTVGCTDSNVIMTDLNYCTGRSGLGSWIFSEMETLLGTPDQLHATFVPPEHKELRIWPKRLDPDLESFSFQHSSCTVEFTFGQDLPDPCGQCQALEQGKPDTVISVTVSTLLLG